MADTKSDDWAARAMEALDEPMRNALIAQADNVIDIRGHCERQRLDGVSLSMPHPFVVIDPEGDDE